MACQLSREYSPADGALQGAEPAHSTAEIPYTTQRDAIHERPQPSRRSGAHWPAAQNLGARSTKECPVSCAHPENLRLTREGIDALPENSQPVVANETLWAQAEEQRSTRSTRSAAATHGRTSRWHPRSRDRPHRPAGVAQRHQSSYRDP